MNKPDGKEYKDEKCFWKTNGLIKREQSNENAEREIYTPKSKKLFDHE